MHHLIRSLLFGKRTYIVSEILILTTQQLRQQIVKILAAAPFNLTTNDASMDTHKRPRVKGFSKYWFCP